MEPTTVMTPIAGNTGMKRAGIRKIGILRANGLGDFIFLLPALAALRRTYPDAEIVYLGLPWHEDFLARRPAPVDRVEVIPPVKGIRTDAPERPEETDTFIARMKSERFDMILQLHGGGRFSNRFVKRLGAGLTVGFKTRDADPLDLTIPYVYYQNETLRYLDCVRLVGALPRTLEPHVVATAADYSGSLGIRPESGREIAVIHPGASDVKRRWRPAGFAEVARFLYEYGLIPVFTGSGNDEADIVRDIRSRMTVPSINTVNTLSLAGLTGLFSRARIIVSNDTGPLHLGGALGTPTIGLYWCANYINGAPPSTRIHRPLMSWVIRCPLCGAHCAKDFPFDENRHSCKHATSFLDDITEPDVTDAVSDLLSQKQAGDGYGIATTGGYVGI